ALLLSMEAADAESRVPVGVGFHGQKAAQIPGDGIAQRLYRADSEMDGRRGRGLSDHAIQVAARTPAGAGARLHRAIRRGCDPAFQEVGECNFQLRTYLLPLPDQGEAAERIALGGEGNSACYIK